MPHDVDLNDINLATDDLVFLLSSPLFFYTMTPRLRSAIGHMRIQNYGSEGESSATPILNVQDVKIAIGYEGNSCFTRLSCGDVALINIKDASCPCEKGCARSFRWFCEEIEFLGYEYKARESAAAEILGKKAATSIKSRIVKLKVGKRGILAYRKAGNGGVDKRKSVKLKLRLWKDTKSAV